ncbi:MAG TPA: LacI family DNA-binding transcriptional regulator, partial [Nitrospiraceae bacterium]|nr:LacI family DNA-binding transcriptional regulator [Nitrospiraceae bacterium]
MTLAQVAKRAGVSPATVSRVLNNATVVKTSTRARVIRAARELNYHPNLHAQSLARGHSRTLGVIVSNMENPFYLDIYRTLESLARARGYEAVMANTGYDPEQLVSSIRLMIGRRVAGLAVIVSEMDHHVIQTIADSHIPCVFYDVGTPGRNMINVRVDYRKGVSKTVEHLHDLGHTRIGFIGHPASLGPINERRSTFLEAVSRCGAGPLIKEGADGPHGGRQAVREMLQSGFRPTAMVCMNDFMALGVLHELHSEGIRVPRDVSVTGFDNIGLAEFCSPPLTTVHIPRDQI